MTAVLFGLLAALANAAQALISKELTNRAPARQLIGVLYVGSAPPVRSVVASVVVVAGVALILLT